jgi:hypothetical protein
MDQNSFREKCSTEAKRKYFSLSLLQDLKIVALYPSLEDALLAAGATIAYAALAGAEVEIVCFSNVKGDTDRSLLKFFSHQFYESLLSPLKPIMASEQFKLPRVRQLNRHDDLLSLASQSMASRNYCAEIFDLSPDIIVAPAPDSIYAPDYDAHFMHLTAALKKLPDKKFLQLWLSLFPLVSLCPDKSGIKEESFLNFRCHEPASTRCQNGDSADFIVNALLVRDFKQDVIALHTSETAMAEEPISTDFLNEEGFKVYQL